MKKIALFLMISGFALSVSACNAATTTSTTTTTQADPAIYEIGTVEALLSVDPAKNYILTANLDLENAEWTPIGNAEHPYSGTFDGNGFTIANFKITTGAYIYNGFFGRLSGDVLSLTLTGVEIDYTATFTTYAGALAGYVSGNIADCQVGGSVHVVNSTGNTYAGLLAGFATATLTTTMTAADFVENVISNCHVAGSVSADHGQFLYVGGLIGKTYNTGISGCSATIDSLSAQSPAFRLFAGGLIGHNYAGILKGREDEVERSTDIVIKNSFAVTENLLVDSTGTVASAGGLIGYNQFGALENDYAVVQFEVLTGELTSVETEFYLAGIAGQDWSGTIKNAIANVFSITLGAETDLIVSGIAGYQDAASTIANSYFLPIDAPEGSPLTGTEVAVETIAFTTFYQDTLLWDPADIDLFLAMANLTDRPLE